MKKASTSPKSQQRQRILDAYRNRGRSSNNLFLVYSVKTDRDWILPSSRQFIHWIHFLEVNANVKSFNLSPDLVISIDEKEVRGTELDAEVINMDGKIEWHEVKSEESERENARSQLLAQAAASSKHGGVEYKIFTDKDLKPHVESSKHWLKVISYAAAIRSMQHTREVASLVIVLEQQKKGTVNEILRSISAYGWDQARV